MIWAGLGIIFVSFWISFWATPVVRRFSHRMGMLDVPGKHKAHGQPIAMLGGSAIFAGILLPTGLHKGLGLSLFIDIITGVLSGGPFLQDIKSMYKQKDEPSLTSHLFCVIDPGFFMDAEEFSRRMESWVKMINLFG